MEGTKISAMPKAVDLSGDELIPVVKGGANMHMLASDLKGEKGDPGPTIDQFQQSIYNWTGSQAVTSGRWQNFFALAGISAQANSTVGLTLGNGVIKFPAKTKWSQVVFSTRITATASGGASQDPKDWRIQIRRPDGTTVIGSVAEVKISGNDISNRDSALISFTFGATDPFTLDGVQIGLLNTMNNTITLSAVSVRVQRIINPD